MKNTDISNIRIQNQHIEQSFSLSAKDLVHSMGAIQAQDLIMAKWAIGLRLQNATEKTIEDAYNKGEIIRTHLMRPTWHFVSPDDIYWMLELTAPRIKTILKTNNRILELTEIIYSKCNRLLEDALLNGENLTREELVLLFEENHIKTNDNRLSHIMMNAELDGLVCSGPLRNKKLTYSLIEERVPTKKLLTKEESLCELARRYITSHGPVTVQDFVWWSGLSVTYARKAFEMNKSDFFSMTIDFREYWFKDNNSQIKNSPGVHLLPAFDELLISYKDRSAIINESHNAKAISSNGIFRPIVIIDNQVGGIWRRTTQKSHTTIEVNLFKPENRQIIECIENEANRYSLFIERPVQLIMNNSF